MRLIILNKIYTVMVMTDLYQNSKIKFPEFGDSRIVGWYPEFDMANSAVTQNMCDINETCYRYALIEECEWGLYHPANKRWWYEYNRENGEYALFDEPDFIKGFCGFTIG